MERQKFVKVMTLGMAFVMMSPTLITGLTKLMPTSQPAANSAPAPALSQDAQFAAQENGYLAVLQKEPNNSTASKGLSEIAAVYVADRKVAKAIDIYQKMVKVAPQARNVKIYQQRIAELQPQSTPPASSPLSKP
jgi:cytochrome c-type biogenesis protein CcmH/NrfG